MAHEDKLWQSALKLLENREQVVLCTLVSSHGSTPREVGAQMLYGSKGIVAGTVGGGCGESEVQVVARKVIAGAHDGGSINVDLSGDLDQTETQACGGSMDVFVARLSQQDAAVVEALAQAEISRQPRVVAMPLKAGSPIALVGDADLPVAIEQAGQSDIARCVVVDGARWFVQRVGTRESLVIVGSGHVAGPLCELAALMAYSVVIVDDRAAYANETNFPSASRIVVGEHSDGLSKVRVDAYTSIVIITRGHQYDESALRQALKMGARYIGMIGSKRRAITTLKRIAESSGDDRVGDRVHSPIGLDIGAQTPEEIALAILAEVVACRRSGSGVPLRTLRLRARA